MAHAPGTHAAALPPHAPEAGSTVPGGLNDLPRDIVDEIVTNVLNSPGSDDPFRIPNAVDAHGYIAGLALAQTSRAFSERVFAAMKVVVFPVEPGLTDAAVAYLVRSAGRHLEHLVLRACPLVSDASVYWMHSSAPSLHSVDLSFVPNITDAAVATLCSRGRLRRLLLRGCHNLTDATLVAAGQCHGLQHLDITFVGNGVTDYGITRLVEGCGTSLQSLAISCNEKLTNDAFGAVGRSCPNLLQFCARNLPLVDDNGLGALCQGIGESVCGLDVVDCPLITKNAVVYCIEVLCHRIQIPDPEFRTRNEVLISGLRNNIFIVRGNDPTTMKDTVHTCLVDNGDIMSACVLMAGTTDLSQVSLVLAKNFGTSPDEDTVDLLFSRYGLPRETVV